MRKEFPRKVKFAALKRCTNAKGIPCCEGECGGLPLSAGNIFFDHDQADGLGGEPTLVNCKVLCKLCHDKKTFTHDNPIMQKADRVRKKTFGVATRKGKPIPGSRASGWKRKMDGTIVKRGR